MSSSLEQHFEGTPPPKSRRWLVLAAAVVIVILFVVFARATLPSQRQEYIGMWKEAKRKQFFYDFRADGTFSAVIQNEWLASNVNAKVGVKGKWKASHEALYLTYTDMELLSQTRRPQDFANEAKMQIGRTLKIRVEWDAKDQIRIGDNWDLVYQRTP